MSVTILLTGVIRENKTGGIADDPKTLASFSYDGSNYPIEKTELDDFYKVYVNQTLSAGETIGRVDWVGIDGGDSIVEYQPMYLGYDDAGRNYTIESVNGSNIVVDDEIVNFEQGDYVVFDNSGKGESYEVASVNSDTFTINATDGFVVSSELVGSPVTKKGADIEDGPYYISPSFQEEDEYKYWVTSFIPEVRTTYPAGGHTMVLKYVKICYPGLLETNE